MKPIRVYYNLRKKIFSVQEKVAGSWKVVEHTHNLAIRNVTFKVSEAGRQRVLREKRKNVHAFVLGDRCENVPKSVARIEVSYNPYKGPNFVGACIPIIKAEYAEIVGGKLLAVTPEFKRQ